MKIFEYIEKIQEALERLEKIQRSYTNEEILVAFRGEPRDYKKTKLMPSIFRNSEMIEKESYLFELMSDYGMLDQSKDRNIDKAIESQHYVAISRMLDITFSILPALYFACSNKEALMEDGVFYIFCFPEHYSPHSSYIESMYDNMMEDKENITYAKNFRVITHSYSNERIQAQSGGFIFFPGEDYIPIDSIYYEEIKICAESKPEICSDLKRMFNISEATLFPEKSTRAKMVKNILEKEKYKKRKISIEDEINTCFDRITFEIEITKRKGMFDRRKILRRLRKEKEDLISYVKFTEKGQNKHIKEIEKKFLLLEKLY